MSSLGKFMKQAARMQQQIEQIQGQLAQQTVEATSGGGAVKVIAKGDGSLASIRIDPQAINPSEAAMLEDLLLVAVNGALAKSKDLANAEMGKVTSGMGIPGLM